MKLNIGKCEVMHVGKRNRRKKYTMIDYDSKSRIDLNSPDCERDLGVLISSDFKPTNQVNKAASKANSMIGLLKRTFVNRDAQTWSKLYKCYVRPYIEFAFPAWSPYTKKDIKTLEKVQERATKTIHSYLQPLSIRRVRGDLIQRYKIDDENKIDEINWHNDPHYSEARGGHRSRLRKEIVRCCNQRH